MVTPATKLPFSTRFFFGTGSIAEGVKNTAFNVFLLFYYNQVLGLSGTLAGGAIFLALCVDAITDPLIGSLSDNTHSRWGRRHPYMYTAPLPMAVCFWLLFNPPASLGETGLFLWMTAFAVGVRTAMTLFMIPSSSMVPELTPNYDERTTLVSYRFLFGWMGGLTASVLGYFVFFVPADGFPDGRLNPSAYGGYAAVCAGMIFAAILISALGLHRLIPTLKSPSERRKFTAAHFFGEVRDALRNPSYRVLILAALFASTAAGFGDVVGLYVNTYFWEFSVEQIGLIVLALPFAVMVAFAMTRPLTERFDKKPAALGLSAFAIFLGPAPIFLRLADLMPPNGDPILLPIMIVHAGLVVTAVVGIGIIIGSMIADITDESELSTGKRQEGMFVSAIAFTAKASSGIGALVAGLALDFIQFPRLAEPGTVPPDSVYQLGLAVGPGLMVFYLLLLVFLSRYRITRERHQQVLAELAERY